MPRKELDGAKLATDITRLTAADKVSPPESRPSLMDAVRQLSGFIETRAKLRWSSAAIAAMLTEAGYVIDAATLRSYRSRLRAEGNAVPVTVGEPPPPSAPQPDQSPPPSSKHPPVAPSERGGSPAAPTRHFRINRSAVPSDRA